MAICEVCGNSYDKAFAVDMRGENHTFDCFECAIFALAPRCASCGVPVVGHGVEAEQQIFCCAHCASRQGMHEVRDRA
jgi:hypothetical protein